MSKVKFIVDDDEWQMIAMFSDMVKAVEYADANPSAMYIEAILDDDGEKKGVGLFYKAALVLDGSKVEVSRVDLYKCGSDTSPCRDGFTFAGLPAIQNLDYIVAWGHCQSQAVDRVLAQAKEGRKRSARDKKAMEIEREFLEKNPKITRDPYGFWIGRVPGLSQRFNEECEKAYEETE